MAKFHVKRGDEVVVIAGAARGRRGKITRVLPAKDSVVLEATDERSKDSEDRNRLVKPMLHYMRRSQQNQSGGMLWLEGPVHISNVMKAEVYDARMAKRSAKA